MEKLHRFFRCRRVAWSSMARGATQELMGRPRALHMPRPLHRAHGRTHGVVVHDHAAAGRRSLTTLWSTPMAETSRAGPRIDQLPRW